MSSEALTVFAAQADAGMDLGAIAFLILLFCVGLLMLVKRDTIETFFVGATFGSWRRHRRLNRAGLVVMAWFLLFIAVAGLATELLT